MTRRRGFTLLETAIVLAITAIGALLVMPRWPAATSSDVMTDGTSGAALSTALREARQHAIAKRQLVVVHLDAEQQRMRVDTAGPDGRGVWRDTVLPLAPDEMLVTADTVALYVFHPTGAAQGRPVALRHASGWLDLRVDPWNGEVMRVAR